MNFADKVNIVGLKIRRIFARFNKKNSKTLAMTKSHIYSALAASAVSIFMAMTSFVGCTTTSQSATSPSAPTDIDVVFDADSAWQYVAAQVAFGPRVPGSEAHAKCLNYMTQVLENHGATVEVQESECTLFDGRVVPIRNVVAHIQPEKATRVILCAHWDSRMWADNDPDESRRSEPIDGANDGASGVGVLLEVARQLQQRKAEVGVDIILFDVEDNGTPNFYHSTSYAPDTWCLGSQYWARTLGKSSQARYAILLDMVGATGARFHREMFSMTYSSGVVDMIWSKASSLGYANYFVDDEGSNITDHHYYMHKLSGTHAGDIIQYDDSSGTSFGEYWHTHGDVMEKVDRQTLEVVGRTVLAVIYDER